MVPRQTTALCARKAPPNLRPRRRCVERRSRRTWRPGRPGPLGLKNRIAPIGAAPCARIRTYASSAGEAQRWCKRRHPEWTSRLPTMTRAGRWRTTCRAPTGPRFAKRAAPAAGLATIPALRAARRATRCMTSALKEPSPSPTLKPNPDSNPKPSPNPNPSLNPNPVSLPLTEPYPNPDPQPGLTWALKAARHPSKPSPCFHSYPS